MASSELHTLVELDLEHFRRDGFVRVPRAFDPEVALALQAEVWSELRELHGIDRADEATWRVPPKGAQRTKELALNASMAGARFQGSISDLLGCDDWERPRTWGGFLVNFPDGDDAPWDLPDDQWHWDGDPESRGLLIFSFYSQVRRGGGGTLLVRGSQRVVRSFYDALSPEDLARPKRAHRKLLFGSDPWLAGLTGRARPPVREARVATYMEREARVRDHPVQVVELTGEPGDAVFCDLNTLHSPSPNRADVPRVMRSKFLFV